MVADSAGNIYVADRSGVVRKISPQGTVTTWAGNGIQGYTGDGSPATKAEINTPRSLAIDGENNLYIADYGAFAVRKVTPAGIISTVAGSGIYGSSGDGGPALSAHLVPYAVAIDGAGNLFISDGGIEVRGVDHTTGKISRYAGTNKPNPGFSGDGGPATKAQFGGVISDVEVAPTGDVLLVDEGNQRVRQINHTSHIITTIAGSGPFGFGNGGYAGDGGPATMALLDQPTNIAFDHAGNLYVSSFQRPTIRKIDTSGVITTFAGNGTFTFDPGVGDGGPATSAELAAPTGMAFMPGGDMYFTHQNGRDIRRVDSSGVITHVAGQGVADGEAATNAPLQNPIGLAQDGNGNIYVADQLNNRVRKFTPGGVITTVAGNGVGGYSGDGGPGTAARLAGPTGVTVDTQGDVYIADFYNNRIRELRPDGTIITVAGNGTSGYSGDGGPATAAQLHRPTGVFVVTSGTTPPAGTLLITDTGNNVVRAVSTSGIIATVAGNGTAGYTGDNGAATSAELNNPTGIAGGPTGDIFVADTANNVIRRIDVFGNISTFAGNGSVGFGTDGGQATTVPLNQPQGVAVDSNGAVVIAETGHDRIRRVDTSGVITTVAGNGIQSYAGDGGPATLAALSEPHGATVDPAGNIFVADSTNNVVREVPAGAPSFPSGGCGRVILHSVTLGSDIGPCKGNGLVIGASGIKVNLNGHSVIATPDSSLLASNVGILAIGQSNVTITGGTVSGFDAGIAIIGGTHHTITNITATGNVGGSLDNLAAEYGDGIVVFFSSGNVISSNHVDGDGVFNGIGVYGEGADNNIVEDNTVTNTVGNTNGAFGTGIFFDEFLSPDQPRAIDQVGNIVLDNTVTGSFNSGISFIANANGLVKGNTVTGNGVGGPMGVFPGNGIGIQGNFQGNPVQDNVVESNVSHQNFGHGIVSRNSEGDRIVGNDASGNALGNGSGVALIHYYDLLEEHPFGGPPPGTCTDTWQNNLFGSGGAHPRCVASGSSAAPPAAAPTANGALAASSSTSPAPQMRAEPRGLS